MFRAFGADLNKYSSRKVTMAALTTDFPFAKDLQDFHLVYDYNVHDAQGNPEKWRYEIWFFSEASLRLGLYGN